MVISHLGQRLRRAWAADPWSSATAWIIAASVLAVALTFRDYGATWDERFQAELGRIAVAWFSSGGADGRALGGASIDNLHIYGPAFEIVAEWIGRVLPFDPVESRHLLNALVGLLGAVGAWALARRLGGPRAGFLAAVLLLTTPFWWGHSFANSKDIPFATGYVWLLVALLRASDALPRVPVARVAALGGAIGAVLAVRPGGLFVIIPLAIGVQGARLLPHLAVAGRGAALGAAAWRLAAALVIGWAGMIAAWPYGLLNPIQGPITAARAAKDFTRWTGLVRFDGGWHWSTELPWSYAPKWFAATLPESWAVAVLVGLALVALAVRRGLAARRPAVPTVGTMDGLLVAAAGLGPVVAAAVTRPVLYDGVRHLLFVVPPLAALGGWALSEAVGRLPRTAARGALAAAAVAAALATADAVRLHPYQYLYFNRSLAGGLEGASRNYELDYWGATGREAAAWLHGSGLGAEGRPLSVATTADPFVAAHWLEEAPDARRRFSFLPADPPDLRLATTRWNAHRASGRTLHVVERMGVPLLYVIATAGDGDEVRLEGGGLGVRLPLGPAWYAEPEVVAGDERPAWTLRRRGEPRFRGRLVLSMTSAGPLDGLEAVREGVALEASAAFGLPAGSAAPEPLVGAKARGWVVSFPVQTGFGLGAAVVAGVALDRGVLVLTAIAPGDVIAAELLAAFRGARAVEPERRP